MNSKVVFNFNNEQDEAFKELKSRIEDKYGSKEAEDFLIYRFLKARDFAVQKAEDMLKKHFEWKKVFKTETIRQDLEISEVLTKYFQYNFLGFDNEGHPTMHLKAGTVDYKGLLKSVLKIDMLQYLVYYLIGLEELMIEQSQKLGKPVEMWNVILDFENFPILQAANRHVIDLFLDSFSLYEANFPERLKTGYIVNASTTFFILYNAVKPLLSAATIRKIKFYGKDGWKEDLLRIMDPDELPAFMGGNRTDPDGNTMCYTTLNHGGIVPQCYYFRSTERRLRGQLGVKTYNLDRKAKVNILFDVVQAESFVEWEFETENNDIAFSFSYKGKVESKLKPIPLIPTQRVNAHMQMENGKYLCTKKGTYIITLDNSYSWLRNKKVFCRTSIIPPNQMSSQSE